MLLNKLDTNPSMAASNSEEQSSKSSDGDESSFSPFERQKSSPASVDGGSSRWKYDVFLSFRGEDTRNNFTDHLYAALIQKGIYTFMDDERLERGTEISSELAKAIEESRFSIVIFSKNYASSTFCLEELAKIAECRETNNHPVIPVFYHVDPSDVRKQKGEFKRAFDKHQQNLDYNKVQRWRAALTQVSNIAAYLLSYDRREAQCIKDIVDDISRRLNITFSNFSGDLVGMNSHLNKMNALLEVESDDVRFIGICGMGGIGKTTIARVVYEQLSYQYEASYFLGNIRAGYERSGLVALQEQLLSQVMKETNLHISDVYEGIDLIRRQLGRKKVLVVLDDVDEQLEQLITLAGSHDWFGPKSRIIVTTRDEHVLKSHAIQYIYKVGGLSHDDALQLFCMKAFKNKNPMDDHVNLSRHIVNYAHGIPLALEVLGSYLCDRTVEQWKSALDSLQDYPDGKILKVLRLSYDGLKQNEKDLFLNIACFFKGENKDRVIEILDYCDFYSTIGMKVLVDKSLITISYNKLNMHDLLQEMGWEIVREQYRDDRGKWSRLWLFEDVHQLFADNRGTHAEKGIMLNKPLQKNLLLSDKSFSSMSNLMLLKPNNVDVSEDLTCLPNELRYLKLHEYPLKSLPSNFQAHNLFELDLCSSHYLWQDMKALSKLKTINLSYLHDLIETPDFTMVPKLEMLDLEGCTRLHKVHDSVGVLKSLTVLNLKGCKNLESFLSNVSGLKLLKSLNIQGCSKLDKFPENLGELECLEELDAGETAITQVPPSIARLSNLEYLSFCERKVQSCLSLPSLSGLLSLKILNLSGCNLSEEVFPRDLGSLCSLEELNLSNNNFVNLPESIKELHKLKILCIQNCARLRSLPDIPAGPIFLGAEDCPSLEDLSSPVRGCISPDLDLFNCLKPPQNQNLQLRDGKKLQFGSDDKAAGRPPIRPVMEEVQLPDSYGVQLKHESEIASQSLEHRPDVPTTSHSSPPELSKLSTESALPKLPVMVEKQLHEGQLLDGPSTSGLPEVEELQLPDSSVVQRTDVSMTSNSQSPESLKLLIEDSSVKHEPASEKSYASDNSSASTEIASDTDIDDPINDEGDKAQFRRNEKLLDRLSTSRLQEIEELQLPDSNVVRRSTDVSAKSNSPSPESSKRLTKDSNVKHQSASDNSSASSETSSDTDDPINVWYDEESRKNLSSPEQESLNVSENSQLKRLPQKLKIEACNAHKSLPEELMHDKLQHLYIIDCQFLKSIQASLLPKALKSLYIRRCKKLEFLSAEETMGKHTSVEHLCIESSCDPLKSFPLALFPKLKNLTIRDCVNFNFISITEDHMSLNSLEIRDCTNLESLWKSGLHTPNLISILLSNCKNLKQLPGQLHELTSLQSLFITECPELDSIPEGGLPSSLNLLRISSCHKLTPSLQWGLDKLNNFSRIEIEGGCRDLKSFPEQNLLPMNLNSLQISRFLNLKVLNYEGLQHLTSLQTLKINSCDKLQSLPEEGLPSSLSYLYISDCPMLKSKLQNRRGTEWHKIAHIPHIQIDGNVFS